jgi:hypothetical protein
MIDRQLEVRRLLCVGVLRGALTYGTSVSKPWRVTTRRNVLLFVSVLHGLGREQVLLAELVYDFPPFPRLSARISAQSAQSFHLSSSRASSRNDHGSILEAV